MDKTRVTFPDRNLEGTIRQAIDKPEGAISTSDLEKVIVLTASGRNIRNLSGLEYCVNLQWLYLHTNPISDISALARLTRLEWLDLDNNHISDFSFLPLPFEYDYKDSPQRYKIPKG